MKRALLILAGAIALGLGLLGILLPGLPTTPFVLVAAACFAKASPTLHGYLLRNRFLGPMVKDWERHRSLPARVKWMASAIMLVSVGVSLWLLADEPWLQAATLGLAVVGVIAVWRIPTRRAD